MHRTRGLAARRSAAFLAWLVVTSVAACSASTLPPNVAGPVPNPTPIVNAPDLHWINRDPVCTASAVEPSVRPGTTGPVEVEPTPGDVVCATMGPPPVAATVDAASPLAVARLSIPLTDLGTQHVPLGGLTLPDGYYTSTSLTLANAASGTYVVQGLHVELQPVASGRPPMQGSMVGRPPYIGPEPFAASLVFDVVSFNPGATLEITGLSVR